MERINLRNVALVTVVVVVSSLSSCALAIINMPPLVIEVPSSCEMPCAPFSDTGTGNRAECLSTAMTPMI